MQTACFNRGMETTYTASFQHTGVVDVEDLAVAQRIAQDLGYDAIEEDGLFLLVVDDMNDATWINEQLDTDGIVVLIDPEDDSTITIEGA